MLYENVGQRDFIDSISLIQGSFDESYSHFGHFYGIRMIDKDGDYDIILDRLGDLSVEVGNWSPNLHWANVGGSFIMRTK